MKFPRLLVRIGLLLSLVTTAVAADDEARAQVMLIGVFHFSNPGRDAVKSEVIDVLSEDSQAYLEDLTDRIAEFQPTAVLLEYDPDNEELVNERYRQYREGDYELGVNEIYQLGFRIARKAGLQGVQSFDEREVHWAAQPLMEKMATMPDRKAEFDAVIAEVSAEMSRMHQTMTLAELLRWNNDPVNDRKNKALYIMLNDIGAKAGFEGADASASWWRRNFRMYANIQKAATPGARVVVIGGQGHTAILRDLLADDPDREAVDATLHF